MKKFLVFFFSIALLTSCSNDDDNAPTDQPDPILGTWILAEASTPLNSQFCFDEDSTITFNEDKTGQSSFYLTSAECEVTNSSGTWSNNGNSAYTITVPVIGNLQGTANFTSANRFTFSTTVVGIPGTLTFDRQ